MLKRILTRITNPPMNWRAVTFNLAISFIIYIYLLFDPAETFLERFSSIFNISQCIPHKVRAFGLAILFTLGLQIFAHIVTAIVMTVITFRSGNESSPGTPAILKQFYFFWEAPNHYQKAFLAVLVAVIWLVCLSPMAIHESIAPAGIMEFLVDFQDGSNPVRAVNGGMVSLPAGKVVSIRSDSPDNSIFSCEWSTQGAILSDASSCLIKYTLRDADQDVLKLRVHSACSAAISEGTLIVKISP